MKLIINTSFIYSLLGMLSGVFYRELTKFNGFEGITSLSFVHGHLFSLGFLFFLLLTVIENNFKITKHKYFKKFFIIYNLGLLVTVITLTLRGVTQVLKTPVSKMLSSSLSGISGIGHILLSLGIIILFIILKKTIKSDTPSVF